MGQTQGVTRSEIYVVIPAFDEAPAIGEVVRGLRAEGYKVIVIDDGSRDGTTKAASEAGAQVLRHVLNRGQGAALQTGVDFALRRGARVIVTFDADGQHSPDDVGGLLAALDDQTDVVLGSRFLGRIEGATSARHAFLRAAAVISNLLSGLRLTDAHCGLRAFRAEAATTLRITQDRSAHASEMLRNIRQHRLRIKEVPVTVRYTAYSQRKGQGMSQGIRVLFDYFFRSRK